MGLLKQATFKYYWNGTDEQVTAVTDRMLEMYYGYQDQVGCMDCANVADCIEDDEATQAALAAAILASSAIQGALNQVYNPLERGGTMPESVSGSNVLGENEGCDLDKLWGWIDGGIENMNLNNIDAQQIAEEESNIWERISTVTAAIPGVGVLPVDEIVNYVQGLWSDDLFEAYEANDTVEYRRTLKCDIFCLARSADCTVTLDMLLQYFLDRLTYVGTETLSDIVSFMVLGVWEGTQVNDTFYLAQLLWLKYGNSFFRVLGLMGVSTMFRLGEASDDWELLCEECPTTWEKEWDFRIDPYTWTVVGGNGEWIDGEGFRNIIASANPYAVYIRQGITLPSGSTVTGWYIEAYSETADGAADRSWNWYPIPTNQDINTGQTGEWSMSGVPSIDNPDAAQLGVTNFVVPGTNIIRKIRLSGDGDEPTWT